MPNHPIFTLAAICLKIKRNKQKKSLKLYGINLLRSLPKNNNESINYYKWKESITKSKVSKASNFPPPKKPIKSVLPKETIS